MVLGWKDLVQRKFKKKHEFVSADARRHSADPRTYEMLSGNAQALSIAKPGRTYSQRSHAHKSPLERNSVTFADTDLKHDYENYPGTFNSYNSEYGKARAYVSPVDSYSKPRPPSSGVGREWDPKMTHAMSTEAPLPYGKRKDWGD